MRQALRRRRRSLHWTQVMRCTELYMPTLREAPSDLTAPSTVFLFRAGMLRKVRGGLYGYLPLGYRVLDRIGATVREALGGIGAAEMMLPRLPLGYEELMAFVVRGELAGFRRPPLTVYQVQLEDQPDSGTRAGLPHSRQQLVVEGCSFDVEPGSAAESVARLSGALERVFERTGLECRRVDMGMDRSGPFFREYFGLSENGETALLVCSHCQAVDRRETAPCVPDGTASGDAEAEPAAGRSVARPAGRTPGSMGPTGPVGRRSRVREVPTPGMRSIAEVSQFLRVPPERMCKTLVYSCGGRPVVVLLRGDHTLSESKLASLLDCHDLAMADDRIVEEVTGAPTGFAGPRGLPSGVPVYADHGLRGLADGVAGANRNGAHVMHVYADRDFPLGVRYEDLRQAAAGERCAVCGRGTYEERSAFAVARLRRLGAGAAEQWGLKVPDQAGTPRMLHPVSFRMEVGVLLTAVAEQRADENGIVWPEAIAPFHVVICPIGRDGAVGETSGRLYSEMGGQGLDVLLDDRGERAGVMFNDADLLGIPVRVTVGARSLAEGCVEIKHRREAQGARIRLEEACSVVSGMVAGRG